MSDQDINKIPESTNPVSYDLLNEIKDLHLPNNQNDVIHRIFGNPNPTVGEKITYQVKDWKKGLPAEDHDPSKITWELFKQREDGTFTTTNIKKAGDGSFTFGETAWNNTYRLDAYVDETTNIQPLGLIIKPEPSKTPKINKVDLLYVDDTKGTTFSFTEKLRAKAYCVNLEFQELTFTLWEDDAKGSGHNNKNKLIAVQKAKVAKNGTAAVDFMLTKALLQKSMQGETDAKQLEFYVTVECFQGKKHATDNVDVKNPLYTPPAKAAEKPKTTPAKTTPAEQKGESKKDLAFNYFKDTTKILSNLWDYAEAKGKAIFDAFPNFVKPNGNKPATVNSNSNNNPSLDCKEKFCIKKGDKNELVREVNIRLAGFGGNVPTDEFTDRTEKMIKQFQRDYMKVPETGKICGNVLRAIDEFCLKYKFNFSETKCRCGKCDGYGDGSFKGLYSSKIKIEKYHKYEYPGIHRSLLWSLKAVIFYLKLNEKYSLNKVASGYRCRNHEQYLKSPTTNHMGKALDLHFNKNGTRTREIKDIEEIRKDIFNKYLSAEWDWDNKDIFNLESTKVGATTWVHYDVREFETKHLTDNYFAKNIFEMESKSILALANELGFSNCCKCISQPKSVQNTGAKSSSDRVDPKTLTTSDKGKIFIKDWEHFFSKPYDDSEGYATIGYGYLLAYKSYKNLTKEEVEATEITWVEFKNGIDEKRALELFNSKIKLYENSIVRDVKVKLYQYEFDALVSLLYNCGPDFLKNNKAPKLYSSLLKEEYEKAAEEFLDITNDGTPGLVKRRQAENNMFLKNIYDSKH